MLSMTLKSEGVLSKTSNDLQLISRRPKTINNINDNLTIILQSLL